MHKKLIYVLFIALLSSGCEGPQGDMGPPGPQGPVGSQGPAGADGADGRDGTSSVARYYDFTLSWPGGSPSSTEDFRIPNFDSDKEYVLIYVKSGSLFKLLPLVDDAATNTEGIINIVELVATIGSSGLVFIREWRYRDNEPQSFQFRTVVAPMVPGARVNANLTYEEAKAAFNLP